MRKIIAACSSLLALAACDTALNAEASPAEPSATPIETPDDPSAPEDDPAVSEDDLPTDLPEQSPEDSHPLPFLVSRFGPTQGIPGTRVTLLTAFDSRGCAANGDCFVTFDGDLADIASDEYTLDVIVPRWARSGPLCLTWRDRTECSGDFNVLDAALIYALYPSQAAVGAGDTTVRLTGDGFTPDAVVWFEGDPLVTTFESNHALSAVVSANFLATSGDKTVTVYSPSLGRCGAHSEPLTFIVE